MILGRIIKFLLSFNFHFSLIIQVQIKIFQIINICDPKTLLDNHFL